MCMRDGVTIVGIPNEMYPRDIMPVVKLVEKLKQQSVILYFEVDNSQSTIFLRPADHVPSRKRIALGPIFGLFLP